MFAVKFDALILLDSLPLNWMFKNAIQNHNSFFKMFSLLSAEKNFNSI